MEKRLTVIQKKNERCHLYTMLILSFVIGSQRYATQITKLKKELTANQRYLHNCDVSEA